ncbi:MAG: cytidylyltransferase domain-containing protein [Dehalococcoidia bacterium]
MICGLILGREKSSGFPGKNVYPVLGRPLTAYPLLAARDSRYIERIYVSTDSPRIGAVAAQYGAHPIERPPELATDEALGEDAFVHGYGVIKDDLGKEGHEPELLVLLMCNAATITAETIDQGIEVLRADPTLDSAITVSRYNMWSPLRARRINPDGLLHPFVPFETFGDPKTLNCDRDSQGDVYFADMGVSIVRPRCLEQIADGLLPQRWMGQRIYPLVQWGGLDVDYQWQVPLVEHWLREHGYQPATGLEAAQPENFPVAPPEVRP